MAHLVLYHCLPFIASNQDFSLSQYMYICNLVPTRQRMGLDVSDLINTQDLEHLL